MPIAAQGPATVDATTVVTAEPLAVLRTRTSEKWTAYPDDVLPLFVAEMDYPLAAPVAEAIIERVRASDTGYVFSAGPLAPAFAHFAADTWGWTLDPANVHTTTDVSVAIVETLRLAIRPGDAVVITPPVYPPFFDLIPEAGGTVVEVPLFGGPDSPNGPDRPDGWSLDLAGLERAFAAGARALLLCNPHNPLGLVHPRQALEKVAELAARYDVTVVSDEIHAPLVHRDSATPFTPYLAVSDAARDTGLAVTSASKAWNLAGVKCALMVSAGDRGHSILAGLPEEVGARTSILGLHASIAAFTDGGPWLDGALAALEDNRDLLRMLLAERLPTVGFRAPEASYLAWLDFRALGWGDDPAAVALEKAKVALVSGPTFGVQGRGFARLNFACSPEVLIEAIDRLAAASADSE